MISIWFTSILMGFAMGSKWISKKSDDLQNAHLICENGQNCLLVCGQEESCLDARFVCPKTASKCTIICSEISSCKGMTLIAEELKPDDESQEIVIECDAPDACVGMDISLTLNKAAQEVAMNEIGEKMAEKAARRRKRRHEAREEAAEAEAEGVALEAEEEEDDDVNDEDEEVRIKSEDPLVHGVALKLACNSENACQGTSLKGLDLAHVSIECGDSQSCKGLDVDASNAWFVDISCTYAAKVAAIELRDESSLSGKISQNDLRSIVKDDRFDLETLSRQISSCQDEMRSVTFPMSDWESEFDNEGNKGSNSIFNHWWLWLAIAIAAAIILYGFARFLCKTGYYARFSTHRSELQPLLTNRVSGEDEIVYQPNQFDQGPSQTLKHPGVIVYDDSKEPIEYDDDGEDFQAESESFTDSASPSPAEDDEDGPVTMKDHRAIVDSMVLAD